jgi:hypothetical protein
MSNNITKIQRNLLSILDQVYKKGSITSNLDSPAAMVRETAAAGTYLIPSLAFSGGLADYGKSAGFTEGDVNLTWIAWTLAHDRGRKFTVDRMDNEESAGIVLANLASEFLRQHVIPEIDATRFAQYASTASIGGTTGTVTADTIEAAIDTGIGAMDDAEVPEENRRIYVSTATYNVLKQALGNKRLITGSTPDGRVASLDGMPVQKVPQGRFYDGITLTAGGGFTHPEGSVLMNFMIMNKDATLQVTKHNNGRLFSPDQYQAKDAWAYDYRIYHDCKVLANKVAGIYVHKPEAV